MSLDNTFDSLYPANHKTVFVLDRTPYFGISSDCSIEFDCLKARGPNVMPIPSISKSLWTTSIETSMEYCRIVWDLFPRGKLIRFVASDHIAHILNSWDPLQQTASHIMNGFGLIGTPLPHQSGSDFSVIHGLKVAIEALSEISNEQRQSLSSSPNSANKFLNRGRVICITSARDNSNLKSLEAIFANHLLAQNKQIANSENFLPIHHCHLVIINIFPLNIDSQVSDRKMYEVSPILSMEVHSMKASGLHAKLSHLILSHYNLASTTVTGIPMKEEQNASSSANYDVEIFHPAGAHTSILKGNPADLALLKTLRRFGEGTDYETITLKWSTPRGVSSSDLQNCTAMHRITPFDINSRPSSCLINFLLNGRSVMLEMSKKSGGKAVSHLLASHGGEIFIHTLSTARSVLEDPPSISEGCGGRVTDYRITDFGNLMRANILVPLKRRTNDRGEEPAEKMRKRLEKFTKYWPINISNTVIFNLKQYCDPLIEAMMKDVISKDEVVQCKQIIFSLLGQEAKHEPLPLPNFTGRGPKGGGRREEHYRLLWLELETFLRAHSQTSSLHTEVLTCLLEVRNKSDKDIDKVELDQALRELDGIGKEDSVTAATRATVIRATTDSPMSPPSIIMNMGKSGVHGKPLKLQHKSLMDIYLAASVPKNPRPEFHGRLNCTPSNPRTKLYPNLKDQDKREGRGGDVSMEA
ncbi:unnamed protein product [Trichogramma brassicae]|uniref:Protein asunder n=1 Tax=Trichogramma brassicae TaxID=86971 RepID=A0A6H5INX2_9HYME|nr:unnamed protein product [Trichogramma brassicae]